jgi:hypothetical protein
MQIALIYLPPPPPLLLRANRAAMRSLGRAVGLSHAFDGVLVGDDIHDRHSWHLPDPPLQVLIAGGNDEAPMLLHALHQAVIGVGPLVRAFQTLEPRILGYPKRQSVLHSEFL